MQGEGAEDYRESASSLTSTVSDAAVWPSGSSTKQTAVWEQLVSTVELSELKEPPDISLRTPATHRAATQIHLTVSCLQADDLSVFSTQVTRLFCFDCYS